MRLQMWFAVLPCLAGCGVPFPLYEPIDALAHLQTRPHFVPQPAGVKMTLRAILAIFGMELPITIRVLRRTPAQLRVLAMEDMGGTLFHFVRDGDATDIVTRTPAIPEQFLVEGLSTDLALWLFLAVRDDDVAVRLSTGPVGLLRVEGERRTLCWPSIPDGPIDRVASGTGTRFETEVQCEWKAGRPSAARIVNHRIGYVVELEVREWEPANLTDAHFRGSR